MARVVAELIRYRKHCRRRQFGYGSVFAMFQK
jgi:hypothetical protein